MEEKNVKELTAIRKELMAMCDNLLLLMDRIQKVEEANTNEVKQDTAATENELPFTPDTKKKEAPVPVISLPDVKKALMEKARAGFDKEVHALIKSYNVEKLSAVPADKYAELLEKAKEIGNG